MKKSLFLIIIAVLTILTIFILSRSFDSLDVVSKDSVRAFNDLLQKIPNLVTEDKEDKETNGWSIAAPDGGARFILSTTTRGNDVILEISAAPFITAGLDTSKLTDAITFKNGKLIIGTKLIPDGSPAPTDHTPLAAYERIINLNPNAVGYHAALDHYGISVGDGNLFEWAKNINTNDKDMVFVLNPAPFISAGVQPGKIDGWAFAKVTVDDANGKPIQVDKILKPFDLR